MHHRRICAAAFAVVIVSCTAVARVEAQPFELEVVHPIGGVWNEYANPGVDYPQSIQASARTTLGRYAVSLEYHRNVYRTQSAGAGSQTLYATLTGGYATIAPFFARDMELEARALRPVRGPLAVGVGLLSTWTNYGYPALRGAGIGIARLPRWTGRVSLSGSAFYYPSATGSNGAARATFAVLRTDVAARFRPTGSRVYLVAGYENEIRSGHHLPGDVRLNRSDPFVGLGLQP